MIKYIYEVVDSNGKQAEGNPLLLSRKKAREFKRSCEHYTEFHELLKEVPPYKIVRHELTNSKVVR